MAALPSLDGIQFRNANGEHDAEAVVAVFMGCKEADQIDARSTLEGFLSVQTTRTRLIVLGDESWLVAEVDGQVVGYNFVQFWTEASGLRLYLHLGRVLPAYRGRGIGTAMLRWSEACIRELAVRHKTEHNASYGANASSTEVESTRLLLENGYAAAFTLADMAFTAFDTLHPRPVPAGVEIRGAKPEEAPILWRALCAAWENEVSFGGPAPNENQIDQIRADIERSGPLWRIAWVGDQVAAQVWCDTKVVDGVQIATVDEVHTLPEFRRRGIAHTLINHALLDFRAMGVTQARLHTDDANSRGAKSLYEKLGFQTVKTFPRYRKPVHL